MRKRLKVLMVLAIPVCLLLRVAEVAASERRLLERPGYDIEIMAGTFSIESVPSSGNFFIRYQAGGNFVEVLFEPATKLDVIVEASVELDPASEVYTYRYRLRNLPTSRQRAYWLLVEYAPTIFDILGPKDWVPLPLTFRSAILWADGKEDRLGIAAATAQDGFTFKAAGLSSVERFRRGLGGEEGFFYQAGSLPGLVQCLVRGYVATIEFPEEPPEGIMKALPRPFEDTLSGITLGPVPVPEEFDPSLLLGRIRVYNQRSFEQGWIADAETAGILESKFARSQAALDDGKPEVARELLSGVLSTLGSLSVEGKLTPEAFALLQYNVRYLESEL